MTQEEFEDRLRYFIRNKPFVPFEVELLDGRLITVKHPTVSFDGGAAMYVSEQGFTEFVCEKIREIRSADRIANVMSEPGMTQEQFEEALRQFLRREPFEHFVVEMLDGRQIEVTHPSVAFGGGAATFVTPGYDFEHFECENVRDIRSAAQGVAS